ncbi:sterol desaturase family protein [Sphingorhabdus sp. Alg239-R122]|uniref:sterol desaturase family protein n=1 Tax=Sphingorhabdus sp. Alg239-R122 TaxID=2305989 RepID=UPI0013D9E822|nr:sterol desaturase family protein [Sphingorhabdus sp. Alg239-R122]
MEPNLPSPTELAVPGFIILILLEIFIIRARNRRSYEARDTLTSLLLGLGSTIAGALTAGIMFAIAMWVYQYRIFDFSFVWWAWPLAFVVDDFAYYIKHRLGHRMRWMWAAHVIHHSSQHYNLSTALRQTWTNILTPGFIISLPLFLLGFHPLLVAFVAGINLVYQFWIHTEAIDKMPRWFEAVMNTPSHHRVHHATNPRYLDSNYAGVFIIWDRMFGTFVPETDEEEIRYGIVKQLGSFNLLWAAFHEWVGIAKDVWNAPGLKNKWNYLIQPPGWSHDGSRDTSDIIKDRWRAKTMQESKARLRAEFAEPAE